MFDDAAIWGAIVVLATFLISRVAGPISARVPALSPVFRWLLDSGPNLIAGLISLVLRRPVTAPMVLPTDPVTFAARLYQEYTRSSGGLNYQGLPCPTWEELPEAIRAHWLAVSRLALGDKGHKPLNLATSDKATIGIVTVGAFLFGSQGCAGGAGQTDRALETLTDYVHTNDEATRRAYAKELKACQDTACVDQVEKDWDPVWEVSDKLNKVWCAISPKSEGCDDAAPVAKKEGSK